MQFFCTPHPQQAKRQYIPTTAALEHCNRKGPLATWRASAIPDESEPKGAGCDGCASGGCGAAAAGVAANVGGGRTGGFARRVAGAASSIDDGMANEPGGGAAAEELEHSSSPRSLRWWCFGGPMPRPSDGVFLLARKRAAYDPAWRLGAETAAAAGGPAAAIPDASRPSASAARVSSSVTRIGVWNVGMLISMSSMEGPVSLSAGLSSREICRNPRSISAIGGGTTG
jgi:hypothetical protein